MQYLTLLQVSDILQVHTMTIRRWIDKGELEAIKFNKKKGYRISEEALEDFLKRKKVK